MQPCRAMSFAEQGGPRVKIGRVTGVWCARYTSPWLGKALSTSALMRSTRLRSAAPNLGLDPDIPEQYNSAWTYAKWSAHSCEQAGERSRPASATQAAGARRDLRRSTRRSRPDCSRSRPGHATSLRRCGAHATGAAARRHPAGDVRTRAKPAFAGLDPYNFYIDRNGDDNIQAVTE